MSKKIIGYLILLTLQLLPISSKVTAFENSPPEPFHEHNNKSKITISYADLDDILSISVLSIGKSTRKKAPKSKPSIGTRLKSKRKINTALEGNRFLFSSFKKNNYKSILTQIRKSLERTPDQVPLKHLNKHEQLAYWLNLYNVTLLEQLIDVYPKSKLKSSIYGSEGILSRKLLKISGIDLSLNDIQHNIVFKNFSKNPVVMYGFYQGVIGGPNIRKNAYTGDKVFHQLENNADEFINSNRGTFWDNRKKLMRVSTLYLRNKQLFPQFSSDLKNHLLEYLDSYYTSLMTRSKQLKANISNMAINDITGGSRRYGGSVNTNNAAMLESVRARLPGGIGTANPEALASSYQDKSESYQRFSPDVVRMLKMMKLNPKLKEGIVNIKMEEKKNDKN